MVSNYPAVQLEHLNDNSVLYPVIFFVLIWGEFCMFNTFESIYSVTDYIVLEPICTVMLFYFHSLSSRLSIVGYTIADLLINEHL